MEVLTLSVRNRLIGRGLATHDRTSQIATISLDNDQVEAVDHLSADDARPLIDVIDEVSPYTTPCSKGRLVDFGPNLRIL